MDAAKLITVWRSMLAGVSGTWVLFEHGSCVTLANPAPDPATEATTVLRKYGPSGLLSPILDFAATVEVPDGSGWVLFQTAVRVSELCGIQIGDIDLESHKIRINGGKGDKDRFVLFGKTFATALRTHIAAHPNNRWLFQTRRQARYTTRRVQQIVKLYADRANVEATPHTFRHQAITWLTRHSGLADAELQLITGHARRETLAIYQHIALDGQLEQKYQDAMKKVDL